MIVYYGSYIESWEESLLEERIRDRFPALFAEGIFATYDRGTFYLYLTKKLLDFMLSKPERGLRHGGAKKTLEVFLASFQKDLYRAESVHDGWVKLGRHVISAAHGVSYFGFMRRVARMYHTANNYRRYVVALRMIHPYQDLDEICLDELRKKQAQGVPFYLAEILQDPFREKDAEERMYNPVPNRVRLIAVAVKESLPMKKVRKELLDLAEDEPKMNQFQVITKEDLPRFMWREEKPNITLEDKNKGIVLLVFQREGWTRKEMAEMRGKVRRHYLVL